MHGYSRLGSGRSSTPSPPSSPRFRHGRSKLVAGVGGGSFRGGGSELKLQNFAERLVYYLISAMYRRRGVLLFAPLVYITGMLLYVGTVGLDVVVSKDGGGGGGGKAGPSGSVYRSPQVFEKLWPFMEAEYNGSSNALFGGFLLLTTSEKDRHVLVNWRCMCKKVEESVNHLLLHCSVARDVWSMCLTAFGVNWVFHVFAIDM